MDPAPSPEPEPSEEEERTYKVDSFLTQYCGNGGEGHGGHVWYDSRGRFYCPGG